MQDAGAVLYYVYDYGGDWELTLRLEDMSATVANGPSAVVVGGRRAAPPEDCGGITDGGGLADLLKDPETFDIDAINTSLRSPYVALAEHNLNRRLVEVIDRLAYSSLGEDLEKTRGGLDTRPRAARRPRA